MIFLRRWTDMRGVTILLLSVLLTQALDLDVCGNFCGPGWCNGGWHSEWDADSTHCGPQYGPPETSPSTGEPSCADACCRSHDMCCASGGDDLPRSLNETRGCNRAIVDCLDKCRGLDVACTHSGIGVPTDVIWAAMDLAEDWCCGHPCPKPDDVASAKPSADAVVLEDLTSPGAAARAVA